jgi:hypothetical protein
MFDRILVLATVLTIAHVITVTACGAAHLGVARAVRDLPDRNPIVLRLMTAVGDGLMFPASAVWWLLRGERFPDSAQGFWFASPIWGFGLAYLMKRRHRDSET